MTAPSKQFRMVVFVRDHNHFETMNDYIGFNRSKVKDFEWYHGFVGDPVGSHVTIEFYNRLDAVMFMLNHG